MRGKVRVSVQKVGFTSKRGIALVLVEEHLPKMKGKQECGTYRHLGRGEVRLLVIDRARGGRRWRVGAAWRRDLKLDQPVCDVDLALAKRGDFNADGRPELFVEIGYLQTERSQAPMHAGDHSQGADHLPRRDR